PASLGSAAEVADAIGALYGVAQLPREGLLHVASGSERRGELCTLRVSADSPQSPWDAFALHLSRARADLIITTGAILRAEPALRYALGGPGRLPEGLAAYRRERLGKRTPPTLWVLSRGPLDPAHPALSGAWAPPERVADEGGLRALVRRRSAAALYSVEAGPSAHRPLYER